MYKPANKEEYYKKMRKYLHKLPPHKPENYPELIDEIKRKKYTHKISSLPKEGISKITFICGCHGVIIGSFTAIDEPATNGIYEKTVEPINSGIVSTYLNKITYITKKPILEFEYTEIDTLRLNVFLSTGGTCTGEVVYRPTNSAIIKQRFVNNIMEELTETCPLNNVNGNTITHRNYRFNLGSENNAARKIQKMYRTKKNIPHPERGRYMIYENEKVEKMINKKYAVRLNDVYGFEDKPGEIELVPTASDAHKLIMIVTRNTTSGCISEKYTLLSNVQEVINTIKKIQDTISPSIATAFHHMLTTVISHEKTKNGAPMVEKTPRITLENLLILGDLIIQEINGAQDSTVPIKVYDLTCNNFETESHGENREGPIQIIDDYIRSNDVACGKRLRKKSRRKKNIY